MPTPQELYETACEHDRAGREAEAVPYYIGAIALGLQGEALRGAYLGLGSTYRTLGHYAESLATFDEGLQKFPAANDLTVFRAMTLYNLGRSKEAVTTLLSVLAATSSDESLTQYRRAMALYAEDLDRRW